MRVSTLMAFDYAARAMNRQQAEMAQVQQQMASGQRLQGPADDPAAAAQAVVLRSALAQNTQQAALQQMARTSLTDIESTLGDVGDQLGDLRAVLVQAGNAALSAADRQLLAADLDSRAAALMGLANRQDAHGAYLFAGFHDSAPPFVNGSAGVVFQGDQGWREVAVSAGRSLPVSVSGARIFELVRQGNGVFETAPAAANTGSGSIDVGQVTDGAAVTGDAYALRFAGSGSSLRYDVLNTTLGTTVASGTPFVAGAAIQVGGQQLQISGTPNAGDLFTLTPARTRSVFNTIAAAARLLRAPAASAADKAQLQSGLAQLTAGIDRSFEAVLAARTGAGAGLRELDTLGAANGGAALALQSELSDTVDVDYARAVTDLARLQTVSQATQKAFVASTNRSLFDLI